MTMILRVDNAGCGRPPNAWGFYVHYLFLVRNMFFLSLSVLAGFDPLWPNLKMRVAEFPQTINLGNVLSPRPVS